MSSGSDLSGKYTDFAFTAGSICDDAITTHNIGPKTPTVQAYALDPMYTGDWIVSTRIDTPSIKTVASEVTTVDK